MTENTEYQIDPEPSTHASSHPVMITLFVLIIMGVLAGAVWFFGYSEWGFAWSGNEAKAMTETPTEVVTSYPEIRLSLNAVSVMLEQGTDTVIRAKAYKTESSKDVDIDQLILRWHSENPAVAHVNQRGRITALNQGTARIMVTLTNSDINANSVCCLVTVRPPRAVEPEEDFSDTTDAEEGSEKQQQS